MAASAASAAGAAWRLAPPQGFEEFFAKLAMDPLVQEKGMGRRKNDDFE